MSESCYNLVTSLHLVTRLLQLCNFYMGYFPRVQLVLTLVRTSDLYPCFPFDPPTQSGTWQLVLSL